jgi:hypothetical protein
VSCSKKRKLNFRFYLHFNLSFYPAIYQLADPSSKSSLSPNPSQNDVLADPSLSDRVRINMAVSSSHILINSNQYKRVGKIVKGVRTMWLVSIPIM